LLLGQLEEQRIIRRQLELAPIPKFKRVLLTSTRFPSPLS
jgi:hypothetical protein